MIKKGRKNRWSETHNEYGAVLGRAVRKACDWPGSRIYGKSFYTNDLPQPGLCACENENIPTKSMFCFLIQNCCLRKSGHAIWIVRLHDAYDMLAFLCYQKTSNSLVSRLFNFRNYGVHLVITVLNLDNLQIDNYNKINISNYFTSTLTPMFLSYSFWYASL